MDFHPTLDGLLYISPVFGSSETRAELLTGDCDLLLSQNCVCWVLSLSQSQTIMLVLTAVHTVKLSLPTSLGLPASSTGTNQPTLGLTDIRISDINIQHSQYRIDGINQQILIKDQQLLNWTKPRGFLILK